MIPYRFRVVLLALGVLFGYGSAFAHATHHHHERCDCACEHRRSCD